MERRKGYGRGRETGNTRGAEKRYGRGGGEGPITLEGERGWHNRGSEETDRE